MKYFLVLFLLFAGCNNPTETRTIELALYAAQLKTFPCDKVIQKIRSHPNDVYISFLWDTFGDDLTCPHKLAQEPQTLGFLIYSINAVCDRNQNCSETELLFGIDSEEDLLLREEGWFLDRLHLRFQEIRSFTDQYPEKLFYLTPELEGNVSEEAFGVIYSVASTYFDNVVYNPVSNINSEVFVTEVHHTVGVEPCIYSNDGFSVRTSSEDTDWKYFYSSITEFQDEVRNNSHCSLRFLWHHSFNCLAKDFIQPEERVCNEDLILSAIDLFYEVDIARY